MKDLPRQQLTIFLIKQDFPYNSIVVKKDELKHVLISVQDEMLDLFIKDSEPETPKWASFFGNAVEADEFGKSNTPSAVLLAKSDGRIFAITFGFGRYLISTISYEEHFGLQVVLNSVEKVRSIDKKAFDSISSHSQIQSHKESSVLEFGIDTERDLLRAVTGKPIDKSLGSESDDKRSVIIQSLINALLSMVQIPAFES